MLVFLVSYRRGVLLQLRVLLLQRERDMRMGGTSTMNMGGKDSFSILKKYTGMSVPRPVDL